jgi:hypothetical protein
MEDAIHYGKTKRKTFLVWRFSRGECLKVASAKPGSQEF